MLSYITNRLKTRKTYQQKSPPLYTIFFLHTSTGNGLPVAFSSPYLTWTKQVPRSLTEYSTPYFPWPMYLIETSSLGPFGVITATKSSFLPSPSPEKGRETLVDYRTREFKEKLTSFRAIDGERVLSTDISFLQAETRASHLRTHSGLGEFRLRKFDHRNAHGRMSNVDIVELKREIRF